MPRETENKTVYQVLDKQKVEKTVSVHSQMFVTREVLEFSPCKYMPPPNASCITFKWFLWGGVTCSAIVCKYLKIKSKEHVRIEFEKNNVIKESPLTHTLENRLHTRRWIECKISLIVLYVLYCYFAHVCSITVYFSIHFLFSMSFLGPECSVY